MSAQGYIYRHAIQTRKRQVILESGKHPLCRGCAAHFNCKETLEISTPILARDEVLGVIGLVCADLVQKNMVEERLEVYLDFVSQIADFIATKAMEHQEAANNLAMLQALDTVIHKVEQGLIILGAENEIINLNSCGRKQLGLGENSIGKRLKLIYTGDTLGDLKEYKLTVDAKETTVLGECYELGMGESHYKRLLAFTDSKDITRRLYNMTTAVQPVSCKHMIGVSRQMDELRERIHKVAKSTSTVLITGESGTGKEVAATAIWQDSDRKKERFVAVNCGAIPEALLESELFGYVKGAFIGADPNGKIGKFELANHGVLFLDEIGDMPLHLQVKLLRVLQERKLSRLGSNQVIPLDLRIIGATNKDLKEKMEVKKFREDLYYRLNVIPLHIPPLRERREDIETLVLSFINRYGTLFGKTFHGIDQTCMNHLLHYDWPGNIRQLENTVEFMVNMLEGDVPFTTATLPKEIAEREAPNAPITIAVTPLRELERREIQKALSLFPNTTEGKRQAAESLGIGIATLYRKLEQK